MKISKQTIEILKNFSQINSNILIREGNVLSTISIGKNIFARATVAETFPKEIGVYDLNSLINLLSFSSDVNEIEFGDKSLSVSSNGGTFEYYYADSSILCVAPDKTISLQPHFSFNLTAADIQLVSKAASITGATTLSIVGNDGKATLVIGDPKVSSTNNYKKELGETELEFKVNLALDNFKVMQNCDYTVELSKKKFIYMHSAARELSYWFAMDTDSTI